MEGRCPSERRPRLVVLSEASPEQSPRVRRVAVAAARAGWDTTVLVPGQDPGAAETSFGPVRVIPVPVGDELRREEQVRRGVAHAREREVAAGTRTDRWLHGRLASRGGGVDPADPPDWRRADPVLLDLDVALGPVVEELEPDVIHALGVTMLPTAVLSTERIRSRGATVHLVYDVRGPARRDEPTDERTASARDTMEAALAGSADAVVTASGPEATVLTRRLSLREPPLVVRDLPVRNAPARGRLVSLRDSMTLAAEASVVVLVGDVQRGPALATLVKALPELPEVHLVVVAQPDLPKVSRALRRAQGLGLAGRVTVVPPPPDDVLADALRGADAVVVAASGGAREDNPAPALVSALLAGAPLVTPTSVRAKKSPALPTGAQFEASDPAAAAAVVGAALSGGPESATALGELTWESESRALLDLYARLAEPRTLAARQVDWDSGSATPWRALSRTRVRLGLGPANYAGQLAALAQALTHEMPDVSAEVVMHVGDRAFGYPADVHVPVRQLGDLEVQLREVRRVLPRYTHLVADAFRPLLGWLNGDDIAADLPALQRAGIKVALLAHGSEIRHPLRHLEHNPDSLFHDVPDPELLQKLVTLAERNQEIAQSSGLPLFVTTPDLLQDLPGATWMPLVVDCDAWATSRPVMTRARPVVLHAPSQRWTKGTDRFLPDLERLQEQGVIELDLVENLSWQDMRERVHNADLVVDQVGVGCYGAFAVEAMAAGRPVVVRLSETAGQALGPDVPLVRADGATVAAVVESLLDDRERAVQLGARSVAYAREVHDGRRAAQAFASFLSES